MDNINKKISVIIPNYNGGGKIVDCIQSVLFQTLIPFEIVVVDNCSNDGSDEFIKKHFPTVRLIQVGYNSGWGVACNIGMENTSGDYIVFLNNDAYMDKSCIAEMVKAIEINPKYGSAASRILLWDEPEKTEVCGLVIYRDGSSCGRGRLGPADKYMKEEEVFCANDCCCLYRREMIKDIGDYDPDFFIYCDETDIGWKHQLAGWKCIYAPRAVAYHAHSRTAGSYSDFKAFHVERNRIYLCFKYLPFPELIMSFFYACSRYFYQFYLSLTEKKGALSHYRKEHSLISGVWILLKAHFSAFSKLPVMWKRRKKILKEKRISNRNIRELFKHFGITIRQMASYE